MKRLAVASILLAALALSGCQVDAPVPLPAPIDEGPVLTDPPEGGIQRAPAEKINLCTGAVAEPVASATGLELTVDFPDAAVGTRSVTGTVTLTNNGSEAVSGTTANRPAITVSQNGTVLWHTNGGIDPVATTVALAPGESLEYEGAFSPVLCGVNDDLAPQFNDKLPPLPSGEYDVSAAIDLTYDGGVDLVTGPSETVTLR